jgi:hypothetical protein
MGHVRKDTLTKPGEYRKHMRPFLKRCIAQAERRAANKRIHADRKELWLDTN